MSSGFNHYGQSNSLQKKWVRILISFFGGGVLTELFFISTGDPNRPRTDLNHSAPIFLAIIIYFLFTYLLKKMGKIN
jgi:hypothetical protein